MSVVNSMGVPISNSRPVRKLKIVVLAVTSLSRLGSVVDRTKRLIKDSAKEISDSSKGGKKPKNKDIINGRNECPIYNGYIKPPLYIWNYRTCNRILYLSCTEINDWRCPIYYKDPL
jgi:hypothetical protein